jgi:hypothetical protein
LIPTRLAIICLRQQSKPRSLKSSEKRIHPLLHLQEHQVHKDKPHRAKEQPLEYRIPQEAGVVTSE